MFYQHTRPFSRNERLKWRVPGYDTTHLETTMASVSSLPRISAIILYADSTTASLADISSPLQLHTAGAEPICTTAAKTKVKQYTYPSQTSSSFATPFTASWHYNSENVSHTRNLTFLKPLLGGPYFDLEDIWDEHTYYEFADRSVEHTMSTMVQEPYVNHVPTVCFTSSINVKLPRLRLY